MKLWSSSWIRPYRLQKWTIHDKRELSQRSATFFSICVKLTPSVPTSNYKHQTKALHIPLLTLSPPHSFSLYSPFSPSFFFFFLSQTLTHMASSRGNSSSLEAQWQTEQASSTHWIIARKTIMAVVVKRVAWLPALYALFMAMLLCRQRVDSEPTQDKQALLAFLSQVPHEKRLQWNEAESACGWVGVVCDPTNSSVYYLRLPGVGLVGQIPADTLSRLSQLRVLSLRSNRLSGSIPPDFSQLKLLRSVYLQDNQLSGEFPASLTELTRITRLDLSSNNFTGSIPFSVNNLTHLTGLFLENNGFTGKIPSIAPPGLVDFNVSNNRLNGSIPSALAGFPASAFANNLQLCGGPLPPCNPFFPSPASSPTLPPIINPSHKKKRKLSTAGIVGVSIAGGILILLLLLVLLFLLLKRRKRSESTKAQKPPAIAAARSVGEAGTSSSKDDITGGSAEGGERNKLIFFHGGGYNFDLEDLLRASAEVLGKGSVGTSYKAVLEEGTTVVVKRLKDVAAGKKEFEQQMEVLGNIKHQNVLPLRAFYYSKDEKLLVCDYMPAGSLSALLHGNSLIIIIFFLIFCQFEFHYSWIVFLLLVFTQISLKSHFFLVFRTRNLFPKLYQPKSIENRSRPRW